MSQQPSTQVTRLRDKQSRSREVLDRLLRSTPLATVALIRDEHPVLFPTGFALVDDQLVIHGSTGSPWLRAVAAGASAAVAVTTLDGVVVARSGFESSFHYRSAVLFGSFSTVDGTDKARYLSALTDTFIPGRVAELRANTNRELAATLVLRLAITDSSWSLKVSAGWPEDPPDDVAAGAWGGVLPLSTVYGQPRYAPDCPESIPVPESVRRMAGGLLGSPNVDL